MQRDAENLEAGLISTGERELPSCLRCSVRLIKFEVENTMAGTVILIPNAMQTKFGT